MDILSAIKREERKLEKQLASIQGKLKGIKAAAEAMGRSADKKVKKGTKRMLSVAARAQIGKATKKRWARLRAEKRSVWTTPTLGGGAARPQMGAIGCRTVTREESGRVSSIEGR